MGLAAAAAKRLNRLNAAKCGLNALLRLILISCSAAHSAQLEAIQLAMLHAATKSTSQCGKTPLLLLLPAALVAAADEDEVKAAATSRSRQDDDADNGAHHAHH